jgi:hypothetical protein
VKVGFRSGRGPAGARGWPAAATESRILPDRSSQPTPGRSPPGRRTWRWEKFANFHYNAPLEVRPTEHGWPGALAYPLRLGHTPMFPPE